METVFVTVISGVLIYVLGQIVQNFVLKPIQDFQAIKGEISHKVKYHANIVTNSGIKENLIERASTDMRDLSCQLESKYLLIPFSQVFSKFGFIPSRKNIKEATSMLILLSNAGGKQGNEIRNLDSVDKLKDALGISLD